MSLQESLQEEMHAHELYLLRCSTIVLNRTDGASINDYATYTASTTTVYKSEPNVVYAQVISFVTRGNGAVCGVTLTIGEEYIFPLGRISNSFFESEVSGELSANLCSPPQVWSSVNETELNGCS